MKTKLAFTVLGLTAAIAASAGQLKNGTEVNLVFRQSLSSKTAKPGDAVSLAIKDNVVDSSGKVVLRAGTLVKAVIERVDRKDHFGKNARIRLSINPVHGIELQPRDKGAVVGGTRGDEAGATSAGAALVFGPVGLVGGYFVVGHSVNIHSGDSLRTVVSKP